MVIASVLSTVHISIWVISVNHLQGVRRGIYMISSTSFSRHSLIHIPSLVAIFFSSSGLVDRSSIEVWIASHIMNEIKRRGYALAWLGLFPNHPRFIG